MTLPSPVPSKPKKSYLPRKTLSEKVERAWEEHVAVIVAPPGFGKSSFVGECYWALQANPQNRTIFCSFTQEADANAAADSIVASIEAADDLEGLHIILEDVHVARPAHLSALCKRLARASDCGAKVLVTAVSWTDVLMGFRMRQRSAAFGKKDLLFTKNEVKACMEASAGRAMPEATSGGSTISPSDGLPASIC